MAKPMPQAHVLRYQVSLERASPIGNAYLGSGRLPRPGRPGSHWELPHFRKFPGKGKFPEISEISTPLDFISWKLANYRRFQEADAPLLPIAGTSPGVSPPKNVGSAAATRARRASILGCPAAVPYFLRDTVPGLVHPHGVELHTNRPNHPNGGGEG